ncbi:unnamed protein product, partial [Rotaria sordida]
IFYLIIILTNNLNRLYIYHIHLYQQDFIINY